MKAETTQADAPPPGYLTADAIAADLARATGKTHVPASTIHSLASRGRMPAPAELKWRRRTLWPEDEVRAWLAARRQRHVPAAEVRKIQRQLTALDEQARSTGNEARLQQGVRKAYRRGLSLRQIAEAIRVKDGETHPSREAVRARFGPYL